MVPTVSHHMDYYVSLNFRLISSSLIFQATRNCIFLLHYNLAKVRLFGITNYLFFFDTNQNPYSSALHASKHIQNKIFGIREPIIWWWLPIFWRNPLRASSLVTFYPALNMEKTGSSEMLVTNTLPCMVNPSSLLSKVEMRLVGSKWRSKSEHHHSHLHCQQEELLWI